MRSTATLDLLHAAQEEDVRASDLLFSHVYDELRALSGRRIRAERNEVTISATGLVHEAYLKMIDGEDWNDRTHFLAIAVRAMRQVLTDRARARTAAKRGGGHVHVTLCADVQSGGGGGASDVLAVDEALNLLAERDADLARLVELRFFGGLEVDEAAEVLDISPRTAARRWARAKAHLRTILN